MHVREPALASDEDLPERPALLGGRGRRRLGGRGRDSAHAALSARARRLLRGIRRRCLAHPGALVVGPTAVRDPLGVARPVTAQHPPELVPVDLAEVVVAALGVPAQLGVGQDDAELLGLRHHHVDELLAQVVVGEALDAPRHRLLGVTALGRGVPGVGRAEHRERGPPPAVGGVLGHGLLRLGAAHEGPEDLEALPLVEALLLADPDHGARVGAVGAAAERHLVHDRGAVDEPADRAVVGPGQRRVVEDRGVLLLAVVQPVEQLGAVDAEGLRGAVEVEPVAGLVLHLRDEDRLAAQRRRAGDPVALGLHADDLRVGVLRDLADQGLAVLVGHRVARLDALVGRDERVEVVPGRCPPRAARHARPPRRRRRSRRR